MMQRTRARHNSLWKPSITIGKQHCLHCSLTTTTQAHCIIVSIAGQQPRATHNCLHCWSAATSHPLLFNNNEPAPLSPLLLSNHEPAPLSPLLLGNQEPAPLLLSSVPTSQHHCLHCCSATTSQHHCLHCCSAPTSQIAAQYPRASTIVSTASILFPGVKFPRVVAPGPAGCSTAAQHPRARLLLSTHEPALLSPLRRFYFLV